MKLKPSTKQKISVTQSAWSPEEANSRERQLWEPVEEWKGWTGSLQGGRTLITVPDRATVRNFATSFCKEQTATPISWTCVAGVRRRTCAAPNWRTRSSVPSYRCWKRWSWIGRWPLLSSRRSWRGSGPVSPSGTAWKRNCWLTRLIRLWRLHQRASTAYS